MAFAGIHAVDRPADFSESSLSHHHKEGLWRFGDFRQFFTKIALQLQRRIPIMPREPRSGSLSGTCLRAPRAGPSRPRFVVLAAITP